MRDWPQQFQSKKKSQNIQPNSIRKIGIVRFSGASSNVLADVWATDFFIANNYPALKAVKEKNNRRSIITAKFGLSSITTDNIGPMNSRVCMVPWVPTHFVDRTHHTFPICSGFLFSCLIPCLPIKFKIKDDAYIEEAHAAFLANRRVSKNHCDGERRHTLEQPSLPSSHPVIVMVSLPYM